MDKLRIVMPRMLGLTSMSREVANMGNTFSDGFREGIMTNAFGGISMYEKSDLIRRGDAEKALEMLALQLPDSKTRLIARCVNAIHFVQKAESEPINHICPNCGAKFEIGETNEE